jgi:hypothetical protein
MLLEVMRDITTDEAIPRWCKGAFGAWRVRLMGTGRDTDPTNPWSVVVPSH